jgi:hypothetical protein
MFQLLQTADSLQSAGYFMYEYYYCLHIFMRVHASLSIVDKCFYFLPQTLCSPLGFDTRSRIEQDIYWRNTFGTFATTAFYFVFMWKVI